jgi:hypothetical protein
MLAVYRVTWKKEQKFDGVSLHVSIEDMDKFIECYEGKESVEWQSKEFTEVNKDVYLEVQKKGSIWEK